MDMFIVLFGVCQADNSPEKWEVSQNSHQILYCLKLSCDSSGHTIKMPNAWGCRGPAVATISLEWLLLPTM